MEDRQKEILEVIGKLLEGGPSEAGIREALKGFHASDIAEILDDISEDGRRRVLDALDTERTAEVLDEAADEDVLDFVEEASVKDLGEIVDSMPPDEAADLLEQVDEEKAAAVLSRLEPEHAEDVKALMAHEPDTAGGIMTTEFFSVRPGERAKEAVARIKSAKGEIETLEEIFVCDSNMKLRGVIGVMDLIVAEPESEVRKVMDKAVVTVFPDTDQEICARLMQKYDLGVLPVVDGERKLLGIITVDDILEVMTDEASEDLYRMAGVVNARPLEHNPLRDAYKRLPWFIVTLALLAIFSVIMSAFEVTFKEVVAVAFFMPVIMALGGNMGIQSSSITVRALGTGEIDAGDYLWLLRREFIVAGFIGLICSIGLGASAFGIMEAGLLGDFPQNFSTFKFTMAISGAIFCGIIAAMFMGISIPMLCHRIGIDPALASGPFVTTLIDIGVQTIYLTLATAILIS